MKKIGILTTFVLLVLVLPTVAHAWPWSWDMYHQRSHRAQEEPAPPQPEGIVSIEGKPFFAMSRAEAGELVNPVKPDAASIKRGRELYNIYCAPCHGLTGIGDGKVGKKFIPPTDLTSEYVQHKLDGDIYYTITKGGLAVMPAYGDSIEKMDRWHIVNYILHQLRKEQRAGK